MICEDLMIPNRVTNEILMLAVTSMEMEQGGIGIPIPKPAMSHWVINHKYPGEFITISLAISS
jgi:hypothetical protein